jgi:hypothetical protein
MGNGTSAYSQCSGILILYLAQMYGVDEEKYFLGNLVERLGTC